MMIFVAGGAGYIGSHTILKLIEQGYGVVVADNLSNSKIKAVDRVKELAGCDFPFYKIDLRDSAELGRIFEKHDIGTIIHFAGLKAVGESIEKPLEYYANNLDTTITLCEAMRKYDVCNIIFSSSATVYNPNNKMPLTEDSEIGGCTNPYGWTKFMCEQILTDTAQATDGLSVGLLRYFNPVGAHESGMIGEDPRDMPNNLMPYIAQTAVGSHSHLNIFGDDYETPDGTGVRDYIHVLDLAEGHVSAIKYLEKNKGVNVINLGTGKGVSVLELISTFEEATGVKIPKKIVKRRPGDIAVCYASTKKAKNELGWEAKKTVFEACADTWRWQKNNPNGYE